MILVVSKYVVSKYVSITPKINLFMLHTPDKIMSSLLNKMLMNTFYRVWSSCYVKAEFVSKNASVILGIDH